MTIQRQEIAQTAAFRKFFAALEPAKPFTAVPEDLLVAMASAITLPDDGKCVSAIANREPGGAFDPRELEGIPGGSVGYKSTWAVIRYPCHGLDWDITALRLESLCPDAAKLPWLVVVNGGSANMYEFFTDPLNRPGFGQYLAQHANVLIVTIPGNFKYGGWTLPVTQRSPQYLLDRDLPPGEISLRNAIYTNRMVFDGLKRLIVQETRGDILIIGHSTSGELAFMAKDDAELGPRLRGRFLGWGSGGPASIRRDWEERKAGAVGTAKSEAINPGLADLRLRNAAEYVADGYVGPLNPCRDAGMDDLAVANRWLSLVDRNRPNIKQAMQDLEHRGVANLQPECEIEIRDLIAKSGLKVSAEAVFADLFAANKAPLTGYRRMIWGVAKWDKRHWNKIAPEQAQELSMVQPFRENNPEAAIRVQLFDLPITHYGHIERPREVAAGLLGAAYWLTAS